MSTARTTPAGRGLGEAPLRRVVVAGAGLIGCSIGLALRERGVLVALLDRDERQLRVAADMGAGEPVPSGAPMPWPAGERADLAVLAVPPGSVAPSLFALQKLGLAETFTDVASVKAQPHAEAQSLGCDLSTFVGGHPLAGRERSGPVAGPLAARADLFVDRPWVLTPTAGSGDLALAHAGALVRACGAVAVTMGTAEHDAAVALVSHGPQLVASALAAALGDADARAVALAGQGLRDTTRIAASDPQLWGGIVAANPLPVAEVLRAVSGRLGALAAVLEAAGPETSETSEVMAAAVRELVALGNDGVRRLPGKHGAPAATYARVPVVVGDAPGELARLLKDVGEAGVNVEDLSIEHAPGRPRGVVELAVAPEAADRLATALGRGGWPVHRTTT